MNYEPIVCMVALGFAGAALMGSLLRWLRWWRQDRVSRELVRSAERIARRSGKGRTHIL